MLSGWIIRPGGRLTPQGIRRRPDMAKCRLLVAGGLEQHAKVVPCFGQLAGMPWLVGIPFDQLSLGVERRLIHRSGRGRVAPFRVQQTEVCPYGGQGGEDLRIIWEASRQVGEFDLGVSILFHRQLVAAQFHRDRSQHRKCRGAIPSDLRLLAGVRKQIDVGEAPERFLEQLLADRLGPRHVEQSIGLPGDKGIDEGKEPAEAILGLAEGCRRPGLLAGQPDGGREGQQRGQHRDSRRGRYEATMPASPLRGDIEPRSPLGQDRLSFQKAAKVIGQIAGRRVSLIGILGHGFEDDRL